MIPRWNAPGGGGLPWRRLLTAALAVASFVGYWAQLGDRNARVAAREMPAAGEAREGATPARPSVGFVNDRRLE